MTKNTKTENKEILNAIEIDGKIITRETFEGMKNADERIKLFAKITDTFGLEALVGLLMGGGDVIGFMASLYPVILAVQHDLPKTTIMKMGWNATKDMFISLIPFLGDFIDFFYKANKKNSALFSAHVEKVTSHFTTAQLAVANVTEERERIRENLK